MLATLWRHRELVGELARREFSGRYRGSFGGAAWSFAQPLLLLAIYTVAFGVILQARWGFGGGTADYALMVFAGLIVFNAFAECLNAAPRLVTANPNFVKKIVFPLEVLAPVMALNAIFHALIGIAVWLVGYALLFGAPPATAALFPLVLLAFFPILVGLGWLLSAIGVVVRDIGQLTALLTHALLFLTPIFYSLDVVPAQLRALFMANPLTFVVGELRAVLTGHALAAGPLVVYFVLGALFAWASFIVFRRMRPGFAEMV